MRKLIPALVAAVTISVTASLVATAKVDRPGVPVSDVSVEAVGGDLLPPVETQDHDPPPPDQYPTHEASETESDRYLTGGRGAPVFDRPSHSFDAEAWERCSENPSSPGFAQWDGCDPFDEGDGDYYHYDKPYGRSPGDLAAFVLWEPGRFERAGYTVSEGRGYYQSDRWAGPVSWHDAGYWDPSTNCGGYYARDFRVWIPGGKQVPLPLPFPVTTPDVEQPVPGTESGGGGHGCFPTP